MRYFTRQLLLIIFFNLVAFSAAVVADVVKLNNGGELRGQVDWKKNNSKSTTINITTLSGAHIVVNKSDIQFTTRRPLKIEQYETLAKQTPETVPEQWEMAEWCRKKNMKKERIIHLTKIVEIEVDHPKARLALGHSLHDGVWMSRETWMTSQGYVKYKNRYITPQELELIQLSEEERKQEQAWNSKVKVWFIWMTGKNVKKRKTGYDNLVSLTEPNAVRALTRVMSDHQQKSIRQFFIKQLTKIEGPKPVRPLVDRALLDPSHELRYEALNGFSEDQFAMAMPYFIKKLKSDNNVIVRRAGTGLERVGNEQAVPYLIRALITTHQYKVRVPKKGITLGTGGGGNTTPLTPDMEAMIRSGQYTGGVIVNQQDMVPNQLRPMKTVTINYDHNNIEVLSALRRITGESLGYDERTWRLWWTRKKNGTLK